jgi:PLP dependent protein
MAGISNNLRAVRERIAAAAENCGRDPGEITLVAVTKTYPAAALREAIAAGVTVIGENRVQEASDKYREISAATGEAAGGEAGSAAVEWHLIGHLQSNKARRAVEMFALIHSVDSVELAQEIGKRAQARGKVQNILVEVNTSGEAQKYGIDPDAGNVIKVLNELKEIKGIQVLGLMTVGPLTEDRAKIRSAFQTLKQLYDQVKSANIPNVEMRHLSMGMSGDFEAAIAEGSTMVRIGSAIFGPRG